MIPLRVLADRARRVALAAMFAVASVIVGYVYFVTLYMQKVLGFSPLRAGLGLLPATLTVLVTSTWLARRLAARFGARPVLAAGLASIGLGQAWLTQLSASGSYLVQRAAGAAADLVRHGAAVPHGRRARDRRRRAGGPGPGRRPARRLAAGRHGGRARGPGHRRRRQDPRRGRAPPAAALVSGYRLSYLVGAAIVACALAGVLLLLPAARNPEKITARSD